MNPALDKTGKSPDYILDVKDLCVGYGKREVLYDVSLKIAPGDVVSVLGHNGAGKTTLLRAILGIVQPRSGTVRFEGRQIESIPYYKNVSAGISYTPAEQPVFRPLTVEENLRLGGSTAPADVASRQMELVWEKFPKLHGRRGQYAGTLSGGEQRMLAVGNALMMRPKLMLFDEPSIGLSPAVSQKLLETVLELCRETGISALLVDQNVRSALRVASNVYFLRMGRMIVSETASEARSREHYWDLF